VLDDRFEVGEQVDDACEPAGRTVDALTCPRHFIQFRDADGAADHCEILNRSLANRQILDWLDDVLKVAT
jgi:hypothetical protein